MVILAVKINNFFMVIVGKNPTRLNPRLAVDCDGFSARAFRLGARLGSWKKLD